MKTITIGVCFFFLFLTSLVAQDIPSSSSNSSGLGLHLIIGLKHHPNIIPLDSNLPRTNSFIAPGFTKFWEKENTYLEFGLADWYFKSKKDDMGRKEWFLHSSLRVEQGWLMNTPEKKILFYIGYGIQPYFQKYKGMRMPSNSGTFPVDGFSLGIQAEFIPKLSYSLSNNWRLNFSIPLMFPDVRIDMVETQHPAWTEQQRKQGGFDIDFLRGDLGVRLGMAKVF